ncbi:hypothetical protein [Nocardioides sp.]|uniref:hypothetical protein n=1 Tax=Nocardioides sp. TaxID=35761 RepID=UPI003565C85A
MAWEDSLFGYLDDLENQAEALYDAQRAPELADRGRAEYQQVRLAARLMASTDEQVSLEVLGLGTVAGRLARVCDGWVLVGGHGQEWLIATSAIVSVAGASERAVPEVAWPAVSRLRITSPLRGLADAALPCVAHLVDGSRHEGVVHRVGADFIEFLVAGGGRTVLIALAHLAAVQSRP